MKQDDQFSATKILLSTFLSLTWKSAYSYGSSTKK